ncbi:hypothetical protein ACA910_005081 [Epithemia clementina (nom. ined.)]
MSRLLSHATRWRHVALNGGKLNYLCAPPTFRQCTEQRRWYFQESFLWKESSSWPNTALSSDFHVDDDKEWTKGASLARDCHHNLRSLDVPMYQQVRWRRNDGARFQFRTRRPTRKQRKRFNRMKRDRQREIEKHNPPGSKAGERRQFLREMKEDAMNGPLPSRVSADHWESYNAGDALVESLVGNTKGSIPTPVPKFLGDRQQEMFHRIAGTMENFRRHMEKTAAGENEQELIESGLMSKDVANIALTNAAMDPSTLQLPDDRQIGLAIRAFRDRYGTRRHPVGLAKALSYLMQDMDVPLAVLGEHSYNALLSCAQTPKEARKVIDLMRQQGQPIMQYSWTILADVYAKAGDYKGCIAVHEEMASHGFSPLLPSYTSLLAACYKVCSNKALSHKERAKASQAAWEKWKEMIIVGIEPDVMAYGAFLRILATKGQPERALNILEEMQVKKIFPTTLCFTSALRAVCSSHEVALRFENGSDRKNMRRELIAAHHGKLAQDILIKAEDAGVEQDQGFVAALIDCAGVAGDLATAKAIYVASQIRKLDQFRTIGSDDHLARLRGEHVDYDDGVDGGDEIRQIGEGDDGTFDSSGQLVAQNSSHNSKKKKPEQNSVKIHNAAVRAYEEREYGKDTRVLAAIAKACGSAAAKNGIGTMWQGRENEGYLCINSLRLLKTRGSPDYMDVSIPNDHPGDYFSEEADFAKLKGIKLDRKHGRRPKCLIPEDEPQPTIHDLSPEMQDMIMDEHGDKIPAFRLMSFEDAWKKKYGENDRLLRDVKKAKGFIVHDNVQDLPAISESHSESNYLPGTNDDGSSLAGVGNVEGLPHGLVSDDPRGTAVDQPVFNYKTMEWETPGSYKSSADDTSRYLTSINSDHRETINAGRGGDEKETGENNFGFGNDALNPDVMQETHSTTRDGQMVNDLLSKVDLSDLEASMFGSNNAVKLETKKSQTIETVSVAARTEDEERLLEESFPIKNSKFQAKEETKKKKKPKKIDFEKFYTEMLDDYHEMGVSADSFPSEKEARDMFAMLHDKEGNLKVPHEEYEEEDKGDDTGPWGDEKMEQLLREMKEQHPEYEGFFNQAITDADRNISRQDARADPTSLKRSTGPAGLETVELPFPDLSQKTSDTETEPNDSLRNVVQGEGVTAAGSDDLTRSERTGRKQKRTTSRGATASEELDELREILPMFSDQRLKKILGVFHGDLGDPSLIQLVLAVRERMPDYVTNGWLRRMSSLTASYLMAEAEQKDLVDTRFLNAILSMMASCGRINDAIEFHQTEFEKRNMEPTALSDRLVIQMLINQKRFARAMSFKRQVELQSRSIDLASYGSLVDYCAHKDQIGSALMLIRECINVHGAHPDEPSLKKLRVRLNEVGIDDDDDVLSMIGADPMYFMKLHGRESKLRTHKKGMRMHMVNQVRNAMLGG